MGLLREPILPFEHVYDLERFILKSYDKLSKYNTVAGDAAYIATFTKYARIAESLSWGSFFLATALDASAAASGNISWTKAGVNLAIGAAGNLSEYLAPVSVFYFSVDAFYNGGWDHVRGVNGWAPPPPTPVGYENISL